MPQKMKRPGANLMTDGSKNHVNHPRLGGVPYCRQDRRANKEHASEEGGGAQNPPRGITISGAFQGTRQDYLPKRKVAFLKLNRAIILEGAAGGSDSSCRATAVKWHSICFSIANTVLDERHIHTRFGVPSESQRSILCNFRKYMLTSWND